MFFVQWNILLQLLPWFCLIFQAMLPSPVFFCSYFSPFHLLALWPSPPALISKLLSLLPLEPVSLQPGMATLSADGNGRLNGLPENEWDLFLCFLVRIPGPDSANRLLLEEPHLPEATLSFPQKHLLPHQIASAFLLDHTNQAAWVCRIMPCPLESPG